jgi:hypothetical protein
MQRHGGFFSALRWRHFQLSPIYGLRKKSRRASPDLSGQALRDEYILHTGDNLKCTHLKYTHCTDPILNSGS